MARLRIAAMLSRIQDEELAGHFAVVRPAERAAQPGRRLLGDDPSLAVTGILTLVAVFCYIISRNFLPFWVWLPLPLVGVVRYVVLFMQRREASASRVSASPANVSSQVKIKAADSPQPASLPLTVIQEVQDYGLELNVGTSGAGAFQLSVAVLRLGDDVAGFIVMHTDSPPSRSELVNVFELAWRESTTAQQAGARLLLDLDRYYDPACAFVGIWKAQIRELAYFATGFEPPSVFNVGWPHRSEVAIDRKTDHGLQKITFGVHRLSEHERWLLYTKPVVDVSDPAKEPFNSVGIIQYAYDDRYMANELWVDYLLDLGLRAHGGELPTGSVLISLACSQVEVPYGVQSSHLDGSSSTSRPAPPAAGDLQAGLTAKARCSTGSSGASRTAPCQRGSPHQQAAQ